MAHKWSDRKKKSQTAVIVFRIYGDTELFSSRKGKKFDHDSDEWKKVIKFFRFKKNIQLVNGASESRKLKRLDYIFGPIADGGIQPGNPKWKPVAFKPMKYQLCLQTQAMADDFYNDGKNVEKAIFFCDTN